MSEVDLGAIAFWLLLGVGVFCGIVSAWVFRRFSNVEKFRQASNQILAHLLEFRLFAYEPALILRAERDLIVANIQLLRQAALPALILVLPFTILLAAAEAFFGHAPLKPGQATVVTVHCACQASVGLPAMELKVPAGMNVETEPVRVARECETSWRVRPFRNSSGELRILVDGHVIGKTISARPGLHWLSEKRTNVAGALLHPLELPLADPVVDSVSVPYPRATVFHVHWLIWFCIGSLLGAGAFLIRLNTIARTSVSRAAVVASLLCFCSAGCRVLHQNASIPSLIVVGVDGMDPGFVEQHWNALPQLAALRAHGHFSRLATTTPPQSPVAWSSFITGLDPAEHSIFDFVHRDPRTLQPFSSISRTEEPRFVLPLGPYQLPLSHVRVISLRKGTPFWQLLSEHGVPVTVVRMPTNYPPVETGRALSGMGTPDLRGTLGTFTFYTDDPEELSRSVAGGRIMEIRLEAEHVVLPLEGPPNALRRDHAFASAKLTVDVDYNNPVARLQIGDNLAIIREGEWSEWLVADFPLIPHLSSVRGIFRVFAKQLRPRFDLYVSAINVDPISPALPISAPSGWGRTIAGENGRFFTAGTPEDTSALRQNVFTLGEFRAQARIVFEDERSLLGYSLRHFTGGLLFFYLSSIDQNSHMLWKRYEPELLDVYRAVDDCIGEVRKQFPATRLIVLSDHGFTTFERAVHLNTWLSRHGFLALNGLPGDNTNLSSVNWSGTEAYALGLNGLYLNRKGRERHGIVVPRQSGEVIAKLREQLIAWRDPMNGKQIVKAVYEVNAAPQNKAVAPDLIVGYSPGYRASWQTGLGGTPSEEIEDNTDAWIGDHCINPADVPGVLFTTDGVNAPDRRFQDVTASILKFFGVETTRP